MKSAAIIVCALLLSSGARGRQTPGPSSSASPTFHLYLLGHDIGREIDTVSTSGADQHATFDFSYNDRGTTVALVGTLDTNQATPSPASVAVRRLAVKGRTYRYFSTDVEVTVTGGRANVRDGARETGVDIGGRPFFPLDGFAPIGVHEALIRYWLNRGRPSVIAAPPAGDVRITLRADVQIDDRVVQGGRRTGAGFANRTLHRLAIDGPVWGRETAWVDARSHELIGLTTWAGGLMFEALRSGYEDLHDRFVREAVGDRMADFAAMTRALSATAGTIALRGATVIDGTVRPAIADATVVIRDGRIAAVGPSATTPVPAGVTAVDARGRFIIPGLWDMHAHVGQVDWAPTYLASGVTTIRDMGGEFRFLTDFRDTLASGAAGPRLLLAGLVDGPGPRAFGEVTAATPDEGRAVVRRYRDAGFQQMKVYSGVTPETVSAIVAEAHRLGMSVTGHVPSGMTTQSVVEAGFDSIAHMQLRGQPGSPQAEQSMAFFKQHGTVMDPTQSWNEFLNRSSALPLSAIHPDIERLPPALARMLSGVTTTAGDPAAIRARLVESLRLLQQAVAAGVPVVAGTDKGIPGFSLPRELELYVDGGMTPLQAVQSATVVPARVMKLDKEVGTIEVGKRADLAILAGNPLERISNVRTARQVVVNGRLYDCDALWLAAGFAPR